MSELNNSASKKRSTKPAKVRTEKDGEAPNPVWFKPVMFGFMIVGLVWIITYYVTSAQFPLGAATPINLQNWNILIGFGIAMVGFMMSTRWK
ncbi:MAG: cell division protein CrgA [Actinomycetota bacterium]